jgi:hypothetical protein
LTALLEAHASAQTLPLPVIRTLGGCGGTLVTRLFVALPRTVVLSETNPRSANLFGGFLNPLAQLRKWRPALLESVTEFNDDEIGFPPRFGEMLEGVRAAGAGYGYRLIVRDFNYADFIGAPFAWPPPGDSSLDRAVAGRMGICDLVLARHPADQLASLRSHRALERVLSAELFLAGCERFLDVFSATPLFRYEDLVRSPEPTFRRMCEALGVDYDPAALTAFAEVTTATGHLASAGEQAIAAPARNAAGEAAQAELERLAGYGALLARLGY